MPLLIVVRMGMAPIPVIRLLFLASLREFVALFVNASQVYSPSGVLVVIQVVVILVVGIIDPGLNGIVFRSGGGHNCHRRRKGGSQQE